MDTLEAMRVFAAVVDRSGFSAAADALDLSTTSVTRQVAALEKRLGTRLLKAAVSRLLQMGLTEIYVERHEENEGSAGMMRKAGFVVIDVFDDPRRRDVGSRRTSVSRYGPHP